MLKRVDNAVYESFKSGEGVEPGIVGMGLTNGGVGYAMDDNNAALVSDEMKAKVDEAAAMIASGDIKVHDYTSDETCPVLQF